VWLNVGAQLSPHLTSLRSGTLSGEGPLLWLRTAGLCLTRHPELWQCCAHVQHCHWRPTVLVNLDPHDGRPLYLQIMDEVRRAVVAGTLRAEDPLPSVRELAGDLVVNPRTVMQAYQELEREGVVYVRRGQGTFVSPGVKRGSRERRTLARAVAKRALLEARRNGVGVEDLVRTIQQLAAEAEESSAPEENEE